MSTAVRDLLSKEEIQQVTQRSDLQGAWAIARTWLIIALTFTVLGLYPNPLTFVLAVFVIGGQQLALAILTHEATHRTLFKTRQLNDALADWLCGRPIWLDVQRYREHHMRHHAHTGTDGDPDLSLVDPFPCSRWSMTRKLFRDLSGQTGLRRMLGLILMDAGQLKYTVAAEVEVLPRNGRSLWDYIRTAIKNFMPVLLSNLVIAAVLWAFGLLWAYSVWIVAYITTFSLYLRIRSIAEHACTERVADFLRNTRTTRAGWLAKLTVAPMNVNYHLEHHLMAPVPFYRLPQFHKLLLERDAVVPAKGYVSVMRLASSDGGRV